MEFGLGDATKSSAPPSKVRAVGGGSKDHIAELRGALKSVAKLSMSSQLQVRTLRSIVIESFRLPKDSPFIVGGLSVGKEFANQAKALRDDGANSDAVRGKLGTPAIHVGSSLLKAAIATAKDDKAEPLTGFCQFWGPKGWKAQEPYVKHAKIAKMFDHDSNRLEISIIDHSHHSIDVGPNLCPYRAWLLVREIIVAQKGAKELQGAAPKGDLEHQVQGWLDKQAEGS